MIDPLFRRVILQSHSIRTENVGDAIVQRDTDNVMIGQHRLPSEEDPCRKGQAFSVSRFAVLTLLFLTMFPGGVFLLILPEGKPYGVQLGSMVMYTAAVALYTFSSNRGPNPPFMLSCPVVCRQKAILIRRHVAFLAALFFIQTTALQLRPRMPVKWTTSTGTDPTPFFTAILVICGCLAVVETLTNRSLLERAHLSAQTTAEDSRG